jgi:hypothetical protein
MGQPTDMRKHKECASVTVRVQMFKVKEEVVLEEYV